MRTQQYLATFASLAAVGGSLLASSVSAKTVSNTTGTGHTHTKSMTDKHTPLTQAQIQAMLQKRLDAAVSAGKLTSAQEPVVLTEATSVLQQINQIKLLPKDQRKAAMQTLKTSVTSWATQNGIDLKGLIMFSSQGYKMHRHITT